MANIEKKPHFFEVFSFSGKNLLALSKWIIYINSSQNGGYSSVWLERQVVALEVTGSTPVTHPPES